MKMILNARFSQLLAIILAGSLLLFTNKAWSTPPPPNCTPGCSTWSCVSVGSVTNAGELTETNETICIGGSISVPSVTNTMVSSGLKSQTCTNADCIISQNDIPINYTLTNWWEPPIPATLSSNGTYIYTNEVQGLSQDSDCTDSTPLAIVGTLTVTVGKPPIIVVQPTNQTVAVGNGAAFSVAAAGCPAPTFQWFFNGASISGATGATFTIPIVQTNDAGNYSVTVSNSVGVTNSVVVSLMVNVPAYPVIYGSLTNYTFRGDTTYYVVGNVNLYGTNTFEGGAVLKYATNASLNLEPSAQLNWQGTAYRPVVMTAKDDNTVGQGITGALPSPVGYYAVAALNISAGNPTLNYVRIAYAQNAFQVSGGMTLYNAQVVNCQNGLNIINGTVNLRNVLLANEQTNINVFNLLGGGNLDAQQVTFGGNGSSCLLGGVGNPAFGVSLKNCLVVNTPNLESVQGNHIIADHTGLYGGPGSGGGWIDPNPNVYPFQAQGAGNYYLVNGIGFQNAGTTNIDPVLLADLRQKTTQPPTNYYNMTISTATTWDPIVPRDTNGAPDLGYHYDPLDYLVGNLTLSNATLTLSNGVALGLFGTPFVTLKTNAALVSQGTPTALNRLAQLANVQEQPVWVGAGSFAAGSAPAYFMNLNFRFTDVSMEPGAVGTVAADSYYPIYGGITFRDCSLRGCYFNFVMPSNSYDNVFSATYTNNVLERCFWSSYEPYDVFAAFYNNLFRGGYLQFYSLDGWEPWFVQNNLFDELPGSSAGIWGPIVAGFNGFTAGTIRFVPGANDQTNVVPDFVSGPLGQYYYPTNGDNLSRLLNAGSVSAAALGLYHYTMTTNQTPEGTNTVSIGYHYVALGADGNPVETYTNNAPDYIVDANGDGLPDWWQMLYFGDFNQTAATLDGNGSTLLSDYQSDFYPTPIRFSIQLSNNCVRTSYPTIQLAVQGVPYYQAVLVDDTNIADAVWSTYASSNLTFELGSTEGWHEVRVGLKAFSSDAPADWNWRRVKLDLTPPQLVITNPVANVISQPMIELQGYCPEALANISYDITNAAGLVTNQDILVLDRYYSTNTWEFTTNWFQGFDIPVTNGVNIITLHATDLAGNVTTTNFSYTLDYSSKTNPPAVQLYWPQDGTLICGGNFTWRGWVSDFTATVTAQMVDADGNTNIFDGVVERNGNFWIEDLPVNAGANAWTLTVADAAGNVTQTNITVYPGDVGLTINSPSSDSLWDPTITVNGTINSSDYSVWVNGVKATINAGNWQADNVPLPPGGTAVIQARAIPNTNNGGDGTGGSGGGPVSYDNLGNPDPEVDEDAEITPDRQTRLYVKSYHLSETENSDNAMGEYYDADGNLTSYWNGNDDLSLGMKWWDQLGGNGGCNETWDQEHKPGIPPPMDNINGWSKDSYTWAPTAWPSVVVSSSESTVYSDDTDSGEIDGPIHYDFAPDIPSISQEHCDLQEEDDDFRGASGDTGSFDYRHNITFNRNADADMKLQTGGKAVPGRKSLWRISATATSGGIVLYPWWMADSYFDLWLGSPVDSIRITVMGRSLGTAGYFYKLLPDGKEFDITPKVNGEYYYTFDVKPTKYELRIKANGITLDPDRVVDNAHFCVGQNVQFSPAWNPSTPSDLQQVSLFKWVFEGDYVNDWIKPSDTSSINYYVDSALLAQETTGVWWASGGSPPITYNAQLGEGLTFDNGQYLAVTTKGTFDMYRPTISNFRSYTPYYAALVPSGSPNELQLGDDTPAGLMRYSFNVSSTAPFSGNANLVQLINATRANSYHSSTTDGEYWLDNTYPYFDSDFELSGMTYYHNYVEFFDQPGYGLNGSQCTIADFFKDYVIFKPDFPNSIWVTLGKITWDWSANTVFENGAWTNPTYWIDGPTKPDGSDEFPKWSNIYYNTTGL